MKGWLFNNLGLKLISLALGFIIWVSVVNISNPEVTRSKSVELTVQNEQVLKDAGKTYTMNSAGTVTVSYQVRTLDETKIRATDFRATVDLQDLYAVTGSVPVNLSVVSNRDLIIGTPTVRPAVVRIETEDIQRKAFELTTSMSGTPAEGYSVGSIETIPKRVIVTGPVSQVGRISSVGVEVDTEDAAQDLTGYVKPVYYDANGNVIELSEDVSVDPGEVRYNVKMLQGKSLSLNFTVGGRAAEGFRFTGTECNVKSIPVFGQEDILNELSEIYIPGEVLDLNRATGDRQIDVDVSEFLPEGVMVSGDPMIRVTLKVQALNTRTIQLSLGNGITEVGHTYGYRYSIDPEIITVELSGLPEDLERVTAADLGTVIDFTHMSHGAHEGSLAMNTPMGCTILNYTPFVILVSGEEPGVSFVTPVEGPAGAESAGAVTEESSPAADETEKGPGVSAAGSRGFSASAADAEDVQASGEASEEAETGEESSGGENTGGSETGEAGMTESGGAGGGAAESAENAGGESEAVSPDGVLQEDAISHEGMPGGSVGTVHEREAGEADNASSGEENGPEGQEGAGPEESGT